MNRPQYEKAVAAIQLLYDALPKLECQGKCVQSCGPIEMSVVEARRIDRIRKVPEVTEATCPLLEHDRCTVYEVRPLICRLFGMAEGMECPWGCKPERMLTRDEALTLMQTVEVLGGGISPAWMARVERILEIYAPDVWAKAKAESLN